MKGTHHQAKLQFGNEFITVMDPPGCAVILIDAASVIVHFHDFPTSSHLKLGDS